MTRTSASLRTTRLLGVGFAVLFTVALSTLLLGDLIGAFADAAATFATHVDSSGELWRHAVGAVLLCVSGLVFLGFVAGMSDSLSRHGSADPWPGTRSARAVATVFAAQVGVAAAALATVSLSMGFGRITGDPGIQEAQSVLPQLGYVVLFVPAALTAGLAVALLARSASRGSALPGWVVVAGYVAGAAQLAGILTLPLLLLPLWVLLASLTLRRPSD